MSFSATAFSPRHGAKQVLIPAICLIALLGPSGIARADPIVQGEEHCIVNVAGDDALNMRAAPRSTAAIVTRKRYGECGVMVIGACSGNWCPVEDGLYAGWVHRH
jgi:hypothetical protein